MKLALVCPNFPPDRCGVGDYTARLSQTLAQQGHEVAVFTSQGAPRPIEGVVLKSFARPWGPRALKRVADSVTEFGPEAIVIEFTPHLFSPHRVGASPFLPAFLEILKLRNRRALLALAAHELHYPVLPTRAGVGAGLPQLVQWLAVASVSDRIFVTSEKALSEARRLLPWKRARLHWLPVGANIDESADRLLDAEARARLEREAFAKAAIPERHKLLLQFGSAHPTRLFGHSFAALDLCRKRLGPDSVTLAFAGLESEAVERELERAGRMDLKPFVRGLGYLPEWQTRAWLKRCDVFLAPFLDGISTRRGSAMAALALGKPVATTRAWSTDTSVPWDLVTAIVPAQSPEPFAFAAAELLTDPERARRLGKSARRLYEERFSWPVIARELVDKIRS